MCAVVRASPFRHMHVRQTNSTNSRSSGCKDVTATLSVYDVSALPFRLLVQVIPSYLITAHEYSDGVCAGSRVVA